MGGENLNWLPGKKALKSSKDHPFLQTGVKMLIRWWSKFLIGAIKTPPKFYPPLSDIRPLAHQLPFLKILDPWDHPPTPPPLDPPREYLDRGGCPPPSLPWVFKKGIHPPRRVSRGRRTTFTARSFSQQPSPPPVPHRPSGTHGLPRAPSSMQPNSVGFPTGTFLKAEGTPTPRKGGRGVI